jgi:hypothetical protein
MIPLDGYHRNNTASDARGARFDAVSPTFWILPSSRNASIQTARSGHKFRKNAPETGSGSQAMQARCKIHADAQVMQRVITGSALRRLSSICSPQTKH